MDSFNKVGALIASWEGPIRREQGALSAKLHGLKSEYGLLALAVWSLGNSASVS